MGITMSKIITSGFKPRKSLLAITIASAMTFAPTAVFAEDGVEEVERISVTGSRIKRVDMEGASPVTIIKSDDLIKAGFTTVGDALRDSNLNAFGSWGGGSNNSWSSQSTVQLKGASSEHTLILLDGQRLSKSPVLDGGAANLNVIPMAAVERIEILTDGASAIYGSDAIAGVINIIIKKDFEGVQFDIHHEESDLEGGAQDRVSFTGGMSSEKGNLVFSMEHYQQSGVLLSDRDYTGIVHLGGDKNDIQSYANISGTGRYLQQPSWQWDAPLGNGQDCSAYGADFKGPYVDSAYPGDTLCAYDYSNTAALIGKSKRDNTLIHYTYELSDNIDLTARAFWAKNETQDLSAAVPGSISVPQGLPERTLADGTVLNELGAGWNAAVGYRFDQAGQRIAEHHDSVFDYLFALEGSQESFDWNISANYSSYTNFTWGTGYLLDGAINDAVGSVNETTGEFEGWDPRDPNAVLPEGSTANYDKRKAYDSLNIIGGVSFEAFELPAGALGVYLGAAYMEEALDSKVDALAETGQIIGGSGGSGGKGERDITSAFFEMNIPVIDGLEVNLAGRYDDYSDFGSTFNPQASISYRPIDSLLLRASMGQGFRAPTLSNLYMGTSTGYLDTINYAKCEAEGEDIDSCEREESAPVQNGGNPTLKAEESESMSVGIVWDITDNFDLSIDYWQLDTENLIEQMDQDEILYTQAKLNEAGQGGSVGDIYAGSSVTFTGSGRIDTVVAPTNNIGMSEREGIDMNFSAQFESTFGDFGASVNVSKFLTYKDSFFDNGLLAISNDHAGTEDFPDLRVNMTLDWSMDSHTVTYFSAYTSSQISDVYADETKTNFYELDAYMTHNISYNYITPWNSNVSVGVNNFTDEEPVFYKNGEFNGSLYSPYGRAYYISFSQSF
jgi:iron complex outermembrane receptor protein